MLDKEGVVEEVYRRGNYEFTRVRFSFTKAEADKLSKRGQYEAGRVSGVEATENANECIVVFKKKIRRLKKGFK
jgi:hypothetical protein